MSVFNQSTKPGPFHDEGFYVQGSNFLALQYVSEASGAVPTFGGSAYTFCAAMESLTRSAEGLYTLVLTDKWTKFVGAKGGVLQTAGTYDATKASEVEVYAVDLPNRTIKFVTKAPDDGLATDMAAGDILWLELELATFAPNQPGVSLS